MSEGSMNILFLLLLLVTRRRTEERGRRIRPVCHVCIYPVGGWKEKSLIAEGDKSDSDLSGYSLARSEELK
jgi:hypothetical protein